MHYHTYGKPCVKHTLFLFLIFCSYQSAITQITMDRFIGVNMLRDTPIERMKAFGFVREYHEWALDEGYPALNGLEEDASPAYPNNLYKWNPSYQSQNATQFDEFYDQITNEGILLAPDLIQSPPKIVAPNANPQTFEVERMLERAPIEDMEDPTDPYSYLERADYLYHYTARFGRTAFSPNREQQIIAPKLHPSELLRTGYGYALYLEDWNEQDKWWHEQHDPDAYATTFFEPEEYAAMLSADYDGHGQNMGRITDPDDANSEISAVGVKNADPTIKVVMGGLSDLDLDYLKDMVAWFDQARDTLSGADLYPFDVINFHHYSDNNPNLRQIGQYGISPEQDKLREQLEAIVTYRDQNFPSKELWLSEFGYDTNTKSEQRVPYEGIGNADRQELQGQWLVRAYLEIAAAGFDRAMAFTLEDVCNPPTPEVDVCGLFNNSGLIFSDDYNNQPKKSWYYTYTLKNVLKGTVYDADLSTAIVDGTDCSLDVPRVYRFAKTDDPNYFVYALWSPTTCDKAPYNYVLDIGNHSEAKLIEMNAPSIAGSRSELIVNDLGATNTVGVSISERPVFVVVGNTNSIQPVNCVNNLQKLHETCDAVRVIWDKTSPGEKVQIWYQQGHGLTANDFDIFTATFVQDDIPVSNGEYLINDLLESTDYTFFILTSDGAEQLSEPCLIEATTVTESCKIPIDPSWIFTSSEPDKDLTQLFDEQADSDPICDETPAPANSFWLDGNPTPPASVSVDLQDYYYVDAVYLFDDFNFGDLLIEYSMSPNGPWVTLLEYETVIFKRWISFTNLVLSDEPMRFLRFTGSVDNRSIIGEFFFCGRVAPIDDTFFPPGSPVNLEATGASCNSVNLKWDAPFDNDISHYEVKITGGDPIIVSQGGGLDTTVFNLATETEYTFSVSTVDLNNNISPPAQVLFSTLPTAECEDDCNYSCACYICLKESWITNLTPVDLVDPTRLVDEQAEIDPFCDNSGLPTTEWGENYNSNLVPPMIAILDLQTCYQLSKIELFDGPGDGMFRIEYLDNEDNWQLIEDYDAPLINAWYEINDLNITTRYLRFTKLENQAKINEIAICGFPYACQLCPTPEQLAATDNDADMDGVIDDCDICPGFDDSADADMDGIPDGCDLSCAFLPGDPCDDGDFCTTNDVYDADCLCAGTFQDSDNDGVCDEEDQCPGLPDTDDNMNGFPDACESDCGSFIINPVVSPISCRNADDGAIDLVLPVCDNGSSGEIIIENVALNATASQSSDIDFSDNEGVPTADRAHDGNTNGSWFDPNNGYSVSSTAYETQPWWELDLDENFQLDTVKVYWRTDDQTHGNLQNFYLLTSENPFGDDDLATLLNRSDVSSFFKPGFDPNHPDAQPRPEVFAPARIGRYVRIQLTGTAQLQLAEVEVFGQSGLDCAYSFDWNDDGLDGIEDPTNLKPGDYQVTVANAAGCEQILDITVEEPLSLNCNTTITQEITNTGGNTGAIRVDIVGGTPPYSIEWSNEATTEEIKFLSAGSYSVTVFDANDCSCFALATLVDPGGDPTPPTGYCSAAGLNADNEFIYKVEIGDISKESFNEGYADFTTERTLVELDKTYNLSIIPLHANTVDLEHWSVYIDFNRDGDFEDVDETVITELKSGIVNFTIPIPATAEIGGTVMRIMMKNGLSFATPCETFDRGEVEDYVLHIVPTGTALALDDDKETIEAIDSPTSKAVRLYPNPGRNELFLQKSHWENQNIRVQIFNSLGQIVKQDAINVFDNQPVNISTRNLEKGIYWLVIEPERGQRTVTKWIKV